MGGTKGSIWADTNAVVGHQGVEYPKRFFARDYAGNRLEFSL